MPIFIKTIEDGGDTLKTQILGSEQRFALLIKPDAPMKCDEDLYREVRKHGEAMIQEIRMFKPVGEVQVWKPDEFERVWRGD